MGKIRNLNLSGMTYAHEGMAGPDIPDMLNMEKLERENS